MIEFVILNWALMGVWLAWDKMDDYRTTLSEKLTGLLLVSIFGSIIVLAIVIFELIQLSKRSWEK